MQNKQLSASSGKHLASLTIEVFKRTRNDDHNLFSESVLVKAKQIKFIDNPQLSWKRKATTNYFMLHYLDGASQSGEAHHHTSAKSHYMQIYFECLDVIIEYIETRFNQPSYLAYENLENLLIKAIAGKDFTSEKNYVLETCKDDIDMDQFENEVHLLKVIFEGVVVSCFDEILTKLKSLSQHMRFFCLFDEEAR